MKDSKRFLIAIVSTIVIVALLIVALSFNNNQNVQNAATSSNSTSSAPVEVNNNAYYYPHGIGASSVTLKEVSVTLVNPNMQWASNYTYINATDSVEQTRVGPYSLYTTVGSLAVYQAEPDGHSIPVTGIDLSTTKNDTDPLVLQQINGTWYLIVNDIAKDGGALYVLNGTVATRIGVADDFESAQIFMTGANVAILKTVSLTGGICSYGACSASHFYILKGNQTTEIFEVAGPSGGESAGTIQDIETARGILLRDDHFTDSKGNVYVWMQPDLYVISAGGVPLGKVAGTYSNMSMWSDTTGTYIVLGVTGPVINSHSVVIYKVSL